MNSYTRPSLEICYSVNNRPTGLMDKIFTVFLMLIQLMEIWKIKIKQGKCRGKCPYVLTGAEREELALPRNHNKFIHLKGKGS